MAREGTARSVGGGETVRLAVDIGHIATVRHAVAQFATWHGLVARPHADFVLAVNELVANAVMHGGGSGGVRLWRTPDALWCEVVDEGRGLPAERRDRYQLPPPTSPGGRGLWLVHQLCDQVTISTSTGGTTVRIAKHLAQPAAGDPR